MTDTTKPFVDINAIRDTQDAVRKQPELGKVTFNVSGKSTGGLSLLSQTGSLIQNGEADQSRDGQYKMVCDEPIALLGTDKGVSPAEYILQGLAGCYTVTLASMAANKGIVLDSINLNLDFDIDLNGFLGLNADVRNGAEEIRVDVDLKSESATKEELESLIEQLPFNSPIHDTLANPVSVKPRLV